MMRIVPWKQGLFTGAAGTQEVPVAGTMTSKVTCTWAPTSHPAITVPLSTACLRRIVLLPFDMRNERVRRIGGGDPIPSLELNDRAVVERIATENCACERARDITARDPRHRRKGRCTTS